MQEGASLDLGVPPSSPYSPLIAPAEPEQDDDDEAAGPLPSRPSGVKQRGVVTSESFDETVKRRRDGYVFTPGCPSCESGMNAPGFGHSIECERHQGPPEVETEVFTPAATPFDASAVNVPKDGSDQASDFRGSKRARNTDVEKLEEEVRAEVEPAMGIDSIGMCWLDTCGPILGLTLHDVGSLATSATCPEMFHNDVTSIKFVAGAMHVSEKIWLCDKGVRLWKPKEAVDDTTLTPLDASLAFEGMKEEVNNMTKCKVGKVLLGHELDEV